MKKTIITFLLISIISSESSAQKLNLGIKGGAELSEINGTTLSTNFNGYFMGGIYGRLKLGRFYFQSDILYAQTQLSTGSNFYTAFKDYINQSGNTHSNTIQFTEVAIPMVIGINIVKPISIEGGIQYSQIITIEDKNDVFIRPRDVIDNGYYSYVAGAKIAYKRINLGLRYVRGFTNVNNTDVKDNWEVGRFQLCLGLDVFRLL